MLLPLGAMGRPTWRPVLRIFVLISLLSSTSFAATAVTGFSEGVNTHTGERPFRRNLQTFQSSGAAFDLYIQALQKFQSDDQGDMFSYYQISGLIPIIYHSHFYVSR
jgi:tyrosinase